MRGGAVYGFFFKHKMKERSLSCRYLKHYQYCIKYILLLTINSINRNFLQFSYNSFNQVHI